MDDKSMVAQGTVSNQAAAQALATLTGSVHYSGGNAMLDAEAEAGTQVNSPPVEQLIATNFAGNTDRDDPIEAKVFTTTGDYPVDFEQLNDEEDLSLTDDAPTAE